MSDAEIIVISVLVLWVTILSFQVEILRSTLKGYFDKEIERLTEELERMP
jgi:hypothetical protein